MNIERENELNLVKKIKEGDEEGWKKFVSLYSDTIFNTIRYWCQPYCRNSRHNQVCPWNKYNGNKETCSEAIDMYIFSLEEIKKRVIKFRGESKLSTFIVASLKYVKMDYFREKYGRLQLPLAIKKCPPITQEAYKLLCRGKEKEHIAGLLNISIEEAVKIEKDIRENLRKKSQEWQHLDGWIAVKKEPIPLITENDDEEIIDQSPIYYDTAPEEREIASFMAEALKILPLKQQRLLQLRFQKQMSVSEIATMAKDVKFLNFDTEKQIYKEIDEALTRIAEIIKEKYESNQNISNEIKKYVKELLETLFLSSEK